jgi:hypothetical protein
LFDTTQAFEGNMLQMVNTNRVHGMLKLKSRIGLNGDFKVSIKVLMYSGRL